MQRLLRVKVSRVFYLPNSASLIPAVMSGTNHSEREARGRRRRGGNSPGSCSGGGQRKERVIKARSAHGVKRRPPPQHQGEGRQGRTPRVASAGVGLEFGTSGHSRDASRTPNDDPPPRACSSAILEKQKEPGAIVEAQARQNSSAKMMGVRSIISSLPEWSLLMAGV